MIIFNFKHRLSFDSLVLNNQSFIVDAEGSQYVINIKDYSEKIIAVFL